MDSEVLPLPAIDLTTQSTAGLPRARMLKRHPEGWLSGLKRWS